MVLSKKMWFFEKVLLFYVVLTFFGNNLLILRFFGKRKVVENFLNTLIFIAAGEKDTFTACKFKPFGGSYGHCVGVVALRHDTDDRSCGHTDDIRREKRKRFGCRAKKSDNISLARIHCKRAAELSFLDVFARRIYDTLAIINILCFMIMYFFMPQSLYKRTFSAFAAAYKDKFSHLPVFFFSFWGRDFIFWAKTGNFLQSATLYTHFSESKRRRSKECKTKDFRGSNAAAKAWLRGGFHSKERKCPKRTFFSSANFTKVTALLLRHVRVAYGKITSRQARGYGVLYKVKYFGASVIFYILTQSTGHTFPTGLPTAR